VDFDDISRVSLCCIDTFQCAKYLRREIDTGFTNVLRIRYQFFDDGGGFKDVSDYKRRRIVVKGITE
jgi:hypothetical protein